ncbi:sugar ABC transporter permease [Xylophilus sp. GOD-11R]|uniref:carbohydrate ABC transporter permease n=1 Tax=Xylophilus sp. GOD-11R TaxID=3089814 RepID=UPI00298C9C64|nr:sugar ABC transporter permease [Xylophilus sp. GOD-11R]WPB55592.1 sugar ABC transporter permease [Xylophilus sp. GOD-11R]
MVLKANAPKEIELNAADTSSLDLATPRQGRFFARSRGWARERTQFVVLMLIPPVVLLVGLIALPFLIGLGVSFTDYMLSNPPARFSGFTNYQDLLRAGEFWQALRLTLLFTVVAVAIQTALGVGLAVLLHAETRHVPMLRMLYLLPMAVTPVAATFTFRMMFNPSLGVLNYLLGLVGLPPQDWLGNGDLALISLLLVDTWQHTPFILLIVGGGLASLPAEPFEAARIDGASAWQTFTLITLPLLKPFLAIAVLFRAIDAFKTFDIIFVLTAGGPGTSTTTLNVYAYKQAIEFVSLGYGAAIAIVMMLIVTIAAMLFLRRTRLLSVA